ncbi:hypothetical protein EDB81DRAFT_471784 [Dactylonectria macrodidyma]|uniref:Secreted protein n=1 Tax=Dactylonectria macrodidyma TaxID=307937 RepID=A0A9P9EYZ6_9HYPO|nr:hypothetical protein EDB81DRAFT_471784 [Dactylonectria macrodidyma]
MRCMSRMNRLSRFSALLMFDVLVLVQGQLQGTNRWLQDSGESKEAVAWEDLVDSAGVNLQSELCMLLCMCTASMWRCRLVTLVTVETTAKSKDAGDRKVGDRGKEGNLRAVCHLSHQPPTKRKHCLRSHIG